MSEEVSTFRLYLLRLVYLLNFALLGLDVWSGRGPATGNEETIITGKTLAREDT